MSTHPRKNIRDAVKAILLGNTSAGTRVFSNREKSLWEGELPAISIYALEEPSTLSKAAPKETERKLSLVIQVGAKQNDQIDDVLDQLAADIEDLMDEDETLNSTADHSFLAHTALDISADAEQLTAFIALNYEVTYYKLAPATLPPDDFETASYTIDTDSEDPDDGGDIEGSATLDTD